MTKKDYMKALLRIKELSDESRSYRLTLADIRNQLAEAIAEIKRLSNPITVENSDVQKRLELLDALEIGGVDKWEWYEESIEQFESRNNRAQD